MKPIIFNPGILGLACLCLVVSVEAQKKVQPVQNNRVTTVRDTWMQVDRDTSKEPEQRIIDYRDDKLYHIRMEKDKVIELYVDNRKVPADSFYVFSGVIKKINEQIKRDEVQAVEDKEQAERDRQQAEEDMKQVEKDRIMMEEDMGQAENDSRQAQEDARQAEADSRQAEEDSRQVQEDSRQELADRNQVLEDREQAEADLKQADEDRAATENLIREIIKEKLVANEKSIFSILLNEHEFSINDRKQPEELHKKFMTKFVKKGGYRISFYRSGQ